MRLLHLSIPFCMLSVSSIGCFGATVVGEGEPEGIPSDFDERDGPRIEETLSAMSSTGPLFDCTFDSGTWPGKTDGMRITVMRSGAVVYFDGRTLRLERVDKSGPHSSYVDYRLTAVGGAETIRLSGSVTGTRQLPTTVTFDGATTQSFICAEWRDGKGGVFADRDLDALVTATKGRR